jgi:tetratricopeptide (TPR) repeat protein
MKTWLIILVIGLFCVPASLAASESAASQYNQGNTFFKEGKFEQARDEYLKAINSGTENPDLYFNLGNAELKSGRVGQAVAAYLKASVLDPRDPDIKFNLEFARQRVKSKLPEDKKGIFTRSYKNASNHLSANEWTILGICSFWVSCLSVVSLILIRKRTIIKISRACLYAGSCAFVLALLFGAPCINQDIFTDRAVIVSESMKARSGPGEDKPEMFELSEGTEVSVERCDSGWCRISARGGFVGWVLASSFQRI